MEWEENKMAETKNYFTELYSINVNDKVEKKGGLSYVSWADAWGELKKKHPDATYTIYENADGLFYHHDGHTAWVKTGVTVNGIEHIEYLPIMDFKNKSISVENVTSTDVNKTIQRSLTKAVARHGLGLYIYAGEDLPEDNRTPQQIEDDKKNKELTEKAKKEKITKKEAAVLRGLIQGKGWKEEDIFPNGLDNLTGEQYAAALERLGLQK